MMQKDARYRYQTARQVAEVLNAWLASRGRAALARNGDAAAALSAAGRAGGLSGDLSRASGRSPGSSRMSGSRPAGPSAVVRGSSKRLGKDSGTGSRVVGDSSRRRHWTVKPDDTASNRSRDTVKGIDDESREGGRHPGTRRVFPAGSRANEAPARTSEAGMIDLAAELYGVSAEQLAKNQSRRSSSGKSGADPGRSGGKWRWIALAALIAVMVLGVISLSFLHGGKDDVPYGKPFEPAVTTVPPRSP